MHIRTLLAWLGFTGWFISGLAADEPPATRMVAVENLQGVTILDGIRPVLTYQRATLSQAGKWPRANYVHPLYNLDGEVISEDFPADHGHHRGVFWAWHQVLVDGQPLGDAWTCIDFQWDVQAVAVKTTENQATISATTLWKSPALTDTAGQPVPCVREQATIVVHPVDDNVRWIDFDIQLLALLDKVRIGGSDDDKGYGGFSPRIKLTDDLEFTGSAGPLEPRTEAVAAGAWVDIASAQGGMVMLVHQDNPGFPQPWILRRSRSMQNAAYPGRQPVELSQTEPLRLRYSLGIHRGELPAAQIAAYQQQYQRRGH